MFVHCHPVTANVASCKSLNGNNMRRKTTGHSGLIPARMALATALMRRAKPAGNGFVSAFCHPKLVKMVHPHYCLLHDQEPNHSNAPINDDLNGHYNCAAPYGSNLDSTSVFSGRLSELSGANLLEPGKAREFKK